MTAHTVHLNTVRKRKRASVAAAMIADARSHARTGAVAGYALIVFTEDGKATANFETGGLMPLWAFPGACEFVVRDAVRDVDEDYRRPVGSTPWPSRAGGTNA